MLNNLLKYSFNSFTEEKILHMGGRGVSEGKPCELLTPPTPYQPNPRWRFSPADFSAWQVLQSVCRFSISSLPPSANGTTWSHSASFGSTTQPHRRHWYWSRINTDSRRFIQPRPRIRFSAVFGGCFTTILFWSTGRSREATCFNRPMKFFPNAKNRPIKAVYIAISKLYHNSNIFLRYVKRVMQVMKLCHIV